MRTGTTTAVADPTSLPMARKFVARIAPGAWFCRGTDVFCRVEVQHPLGEHVVAQVHGDDSDGVTVRVGANVVRLSVQRRPYHDLVLVVIG
jgi:hypothetical protein